MGNAHGSAELPPQISPWRAWLNVLAITLLGCLLFGLGCFVLLGYLPSFILFSVHAGLYVLGKRSLTPVFVAHGIYNVVGEPYLLMMTIAAMPH